MKAVKFFTEQDEITVNIEAANLTRRSTGVTDGATDYFTSGAGVEHVGSLNTETAKIRVAIDGQEVEPIRTGRDGLFHIVRRGNDVFLE